LRLIKAFANRLHQRYNTFVRWSYTGRGTCATAGSDLQRCDWLKLQLSMSAAEMLEPEARHIEKNGMPARNKTSRHGETRGSTPVERGQERSLRVLHVMPPGKHFGPLRATSIDLDTRDFVLFSRHRETTDVVVDRVEPLFDGVSTNFYPEKAETSHRAAAAHVARTAREVGADVIVVQQRLPLAAEIARAAPQSRIVLHTHNFQKSFADRSGAERVIRKAYQRRLYRRLDGIIHVSNTCERDFEDHWGDIGLPSAVIGNGLDFDEWEPQEVRAREVLCVARFAPEKGVLEAAEALAKVLTEFPDWRARIILSQVDRHPAYWDAFRSGVSGLGNQVVVETDQPFEEVKRAYERAAVAVVPSKWVEPFGRTALEAHAGGAALISSGSGGLSEISGDTALMLPDVSAEAIAAAVRVLLASDQQRSQLANAGAARVRNRLDIRRQARLMDEFLHNVVSQSNSRGCNV